MKPILTTLFVVAMASAAFGQAVPDDSTSPDVRILRCKWITRVNRFVLEMKLENTGSRDVRSIGWDYASIDPATKQEVTSYHFFNEIKIRAHKEQTLTIPFRVFPAGIALTDGSSAERVVLNCVVFSDKSEWRRKSFHGPCEPPKLPSQR